MRDNGQMRTVCKSAAVHFALVAMLLRALLPAGWMPAAIANADASPFVICTVDGPVHAPARHAPAHDRAGAPCIFAAVAPLSSPLAHAVAPLFVADWSRIDFAPRIEAASGATLYRLNAPRAPPRLA
jgi:hypothetical protein